MHAVFLVPLPTDSAGVEKGDLHLTRRYSSVPLQCLGFTRWLWGEQMPNISGPLSPFYFAPKW